MAGQPNLVFGNKFATLDAAKSAFEFISKEKSKVFSEDHYYDFIGCS